jgi:hypothetical protein
MRKSEIRCPVASTSAYTLSKNEAYDPCTSLCAMIKHHDPMKNFIIFFIALCKKPHDKIIYLDPYKTFSFL